MRQFSFMFFLMLGVSACEPAAPTVSADHQRTLETAASMEKAGNDAAAINLYKELLVRGGASTDIYLKLSQALRRLNRHAEAAELLREGVTYSKNDPKVVHAQALALIAAEKPADAIALFDTLLAADAANVVYQNGKAVALDHLGKHEDAQAIYQSILKTAPDSLMTKNNLGLSLVLSGKPDEAIALLSPLLDDSKANPTIRQNLALAYGLSGDSKRAADISASHLSPAEIEENTRFYQLHKKTTPKNTGGKKTKKPSVTSGG